MTIWTELACAWVALYTGAAGKAMLGASASASKAKTRAASARTDETTLGDVLGDVTVIRPCAGAEPDLARRLASSGGAGHVIFVVPSPTDAALPDIEWAAVELRDAGVDVHIIQMSARGPNRKAEQMAAAVSSIAGARSPQAPMVFADSDIDLSSVDLAALTAPLASLDPSASSAAVWAPPVEAGPRRTAGDWLSHATLGATLHAFPLLAAIDPRGVVGKLFATTRAAIDRAGGLGDLHLYIGEDVELARRFLAAGLTISVAPIVAPSRASGRSAADVASRYLRWLHAVRAQRPLLLVSYPLLIAAGPGLLLLALVAATMQARVALLAAAFGLAVRALVAAFAHRATASTLPLRSLPLAALRGDFVLLSAWSRALFVRQVTWRGSVLTFGQGGRLRA